MSKEGRPTSPTIPNIAPRGARQPERWREITSADLFSGDREIHIRHADGIYTLRQTNNGKLILTK